MSLTFDYRTTPTPVRATATPVPRGNRAGDAVPLLTPLSNAWWIEWYRHCVTRVLTAYETLYQRAASRHFGSLDLGRLGHVAAVNVSLLVPYALSGELRMAALAVLHTNNAVPADTGFSVAFSDVYVLGHLSYGLSLFAPWRYRAQVIGLVVVLGSVLWRVLDPASLVLYAGFVLCLYALLRLRALSGLWRIAATFGVYLGFMYACQLVSTGVGAGWFQHESTAIAAILRFGTGFIPTLWYACYEFKAGPQPATPLFGYLACRLFSAPVFPMSELRLSSHDTRRLELSGLYSLGSSCFAFMAGKVLGEYAMGAAQNQDLHGFDLLMRSYAYYLAQGFGLMAGMNMFIAWARLLGVPMRAGFGFWLLARTPNERWRTWNLLFREWLITAVFYPLMRAKKGLFVSIMAALVISGLIHSISFLLPEYFTLSRFWRTQAYWAINGLTIYVVVRINQSCPSIISRLRMRESVLWSVAGVVLTSSFYSILFMMRENCQSLADMLGYLRRLVS